VPRRLLAFTLLLASARTRRAPVTSEVFSQLQGRLGAYRDKVHQVSISIDPEHDTPGVPRE
jgi:protein SCO1/2